MCMSLHLLGAELHRGHGGKDPEVSERAQTMPGVRSRGAQLLEAAFQRAGGPTQRRLWLGSLLQDAQPALCGVGWVPLYFQSWWYVAETSNVVVIPVIAVYCCRREGNFFFHVPWDESKPVEIC